MHRPLQLKGHCGAKHTVYDDGTHEFNIPAVRDAIGGGYNRVEGLQDVSVKVAVMVVTSINEGSTVRVYTLKETIDATANDMAVITEECCKLGIPVPTVESTSMVQTPLDYNLSLEKFIWDVTFESAGMYVHHSK